MTRTASSGIEALRSAITGPVLLPEEAGYDAARAVWNGDIDRRPAVITQCRTQDDVVAALEYARSVRGWRSRSAVEATRSAGPRSATAVS